jgi:hypothetical protein
MKQIQLLYIGVFLLAIQQIKAQEKPEMNTYQKPSNSIILETGIYLSLPVHIEMYRTHRLGIGLTFRAAKKITTKTDIGVRLDYDYRFARDLPPDFTNVHSPEEETIERALHRNFSLICIKPNVQFNLKSRWFLGLETGVGYAISDENGKIGLGFVSEYAGEAQFGFCSGAYLGKYFSLDHKKKDFGISLNLTNFVSHGHAENSLGLKFNYVFNK